MDMGRGRGQPFMNRGRGGGIVRGFGAWRGNPSFRGFRGIPHANMKPVRGGHWGLHHRGGRGGNFPQPKVGIMQPHITTPRTSKTVGKWTIYYTDKGQPYYYHASTKKTQWECPKEVSEELKKAPASEWAIYNTGDKTYYFNIVTGQSTFVKPKEIEIEEKKKLVAPTQKTMEPKPKKAESESWVTKVIVAAPDANTTSASLSKEVSSAVNTTDFKVEEDSIRKKRQKKAGPTYQTKEEAVNAFKALLAEKKITEDDHWNTTLSKIISDQRYRALKTLSERKKVFKQYKEELGEKMVQQKRVRDKKSKSDFFDMLEECKEIKANMHYHSILPFIEDDPRFKCLGEDLRQDYTLRYVHEMEEKERAERKKKYDAAADKLVAKLKKAGVTHKSRASEIEKDYLDDHDLSDLRSDEINRVIKKYIRDLERKRDEERRRGRDEKRKKEREAREKRREQERAEEKDLKSHLEELTLRDEPLFHAKSRWEDVKDQDDFKNDPRYQVFVESGRGRRAYIVFEHFCQKLDSELQSDKKILKKHLKAEKVTITPEDTVAALMEKHGASDDIKEITKSNVRLLLFEMIAKAEFREREERVRRERNEKRKRSHSRSRSPRSSRKTRGRSPRKRSRSRY